MLLTKPLCYYLNLCHAGAPPPPSQKYQAETMPLRVGQVLTKPVKNLCAAKPLCC